MKKLLVKKMVALAIAMAATLQTGCQTTQTIATSPKTNTAEARPSPETGTIEGKTFQQLGFQRLGAKSDDGKSGVDKNGPMKADVMGLIGGPSLPSTDTALAATTIPYGDDSQATIDTRSSPPSCSSRVESFLSSLRSEGFVGTPRIVRLPIGTLFLCDFGENVTRFMLIAKAGLIDPQISAAAPYAPFVCQADGEYFVGLSSR